MIYNILIGGAAGQGIDTTSSILELILKRKGFYVFSNKDYMSRVRGGHNFIQIRFGTDPVYSHHPKIDVILALDQNTIDIHSERLSKRGVLICDSDLISGFNNTLIIPMKSIAQDVGNRKVFGSVALGAIIKLFGLSLAGVENTFSKKFSKDIANINYEGFLKGYESAKDIQFKLNETNKDEHILISGNQAIALGALAGGVTLYSAYPMTPATSIMTYLSRKQKEAGIVVDQAEDEISAINAVIGASYAGIRAMTGTSGGGFSLMVEGLGLAAISETPLVVVNVQRPGPATGLPTRTSQSDLSFSLTASQDEFPRMIISVRNPEDAFYQTFRALNLADKYQIPVLILSDQYLADYTQTIEPFNFEQLSIERYISYDPNESNSRNKRYLFTENGVSPRLIPGKLPKTTILADSHEHNEYGFVDESNGNRIKMMEKRMNKLKYLKVELLEPDYFGCEEPETLLLCWGSVYGAVREAVQNLTSEGASIGALIFGDLWPLPEKLLEKYCLSAKKVVNIEENYTGQLSRLIRHETGIECDYSILKYDGRHFSGMEVYNRVKSEVL